MLATSCASTKGELGVPPVSPPIIVSIISISSGKSTSTNLANQRIIGLLVYVHGIGRPLLRIALGKFSPVLPLVVFIVSHIAFVIRSSARPGEKRWWIG